MTFLTRKAVPRRTMLKGMGASVALPLLDSMMPALSAQASGSKQAPMRLGFVYAAHGVIHSEWKPRQTGRQYELPPNRHKDSWAGLVSIRIRRKPVVS